MEAKVDVRKLQMLNDRIIQTLEALTQVRASVHGIGQNGPYSAYGQLGMPSPVYPGALGHTPLPSPYSQWPVPLNGGFAPIGLSHSSYPQSPFVPQLTPWQASAQIPPYAYAQQAYTQQPYAQWSPFAPMGLSHSGIDEVERRIVEQRASDVTRLMQTFPYGAYV